MAYVDSRLDRVRSWDDLKQALDLRAPTVKKLQASDPHAPEERDDDGKITQPLGHLAWNAAGLTTSDAKAVWITLHETPDEPATNNDPKLDNSTPDK